MKRTNFCSFRWIMIITALVSLLAVQGGSRASATIIPLTAKPVSIALNGDSLDDDVQPSDNPEGEDPVSLVEKAPVGHPPSDIPAPTEIRQDDMLILGQPSLPEGELKPPSTDSQVEFKPVSDVERPAAEESIPGPARLAGWNEVMSETFESVFPSGAWSTYDGDGTTNGEYYWDDDNFYPHNGSWSAWAARGGANGLDPSSYYYPNNANSWMVYGPFDLSDASDAELLFYYWNNSEQDYDYFGWYASADGLYYYGTRVSGASEGWTYVNFDLTAVPSLGNLTGDSSVWIAYVFSSDGTNAYDGPFVDDIYLDKYSLAGQPNLVPYTPTNWDFPIVPSNVTGTHTVSSLYVDQSTYIDWAVLNEGAATTTTFTNCLYYDNTQLNCWDMTGGLNQNYYTYIQDWLLTLTPSPGAHTLKIVADVNHVIAENNETDNIWEHSFTWIATKPNLAPYTPSGWTYPIVPSTVQDTHTLTTLYAAQTTYVDWAVINSGVATSTTFRNCLYLDNSQIRCWDWTSALAQGNYIFVPDWTLSPAPTAGAHTLKIVTDVNNAVTESNESDNSWERSFTWLGSESQVYLPVVLRDFMYYFEGPAEMEPNDTYLQANGPLRSGHDYSGFPDDDKDYFSIYLRDSGQITIDLSNHTGTGVQLQLFYQSTSNRVGVDMKAPYQIKYSGSAGWYFIYIYTAGGYNSSTPYTLRATHP